MTDKPTLIHVAGCAVAVAAIIYTASAWYVAPAKQYLMLPCVDGVSDDVCVVINALRFDSENWKMDSYGINNIRLRVGIWIANAPKYELYYNTGRTAHLLDGIQVSLNGSDQIALNEAVARFIRDHAPAKREQFRKFVLRPH